MRADRESSISEYVHGNGHDDDICLVKVQRCGELDLGGWIRVGMLMLLLLLMMMMMMMIMIREGFRNIITA